MVTITTVHRNHPPTGNGPFIEEEGSNRFRHQHIHLTNLEGWKVQRIHPPDGFLKAESWPRHIRSTGPPTFLSISAAVIVSTGRLITCTRKLLQGSYVPVFPISSHEKVPKKCPGGTPSPFRKKLDSMPVLPKPRTSIFLVRKALASANKRTTSPMDEA